MKQLFLSFLFVFSAAVYSQDTLRIDDALSIALERNYDILLAQNATAIDETNNSWSSVGMLPSVGAVLGGDYALNNIHQQNANGEKTRYPHQSALSGTAGIELSWAISNGGQLFVTKEKLAEIQALGEIRFQEQVYETTSLVIAAYYDVVRQQQQMKHIEELISYNKERVLLAQTGFRSGSQKKTDLLQAQIDLNVTLEDSIMQVEAIRITQRLLNNLLGREANVPFAVEEEIPMDYLPDEADLFARLEKRNTKLLAAQKQIEIANLALRENKRSYYPSLGLSAGTYVSGAYNSQGNPLRNRLFSTQVGATLAIPIYQGGDTKRKTDVARLEVKSAEYDLDKLKLELHTELQNALADFDNQQKLLKIEEENILLARENMTISLQRLRLGQTISLEVHLAQQNYVQSATRLISFKYNLKIAETQLKLLVAGL
jgi:outer membrane protein TolC